MESDERLISGRFRLRHELGSGGSSSVHLALDEGRGRPVALKLLRAEFAATPSGRAAFRAEALSTLRIRSPYLASVVAIGVDEDADAPEPWIAYELVDGVTIRDLVDTDGPLRPALVATVGVGALKGLRAVHRAGLAHRDVSPSNIMVSVQGGGPPHPGGVRLLDLGLAVVIAHSVAQGAVDAVASRQSALRLS